MSTLPKTFTITSKEFNNFDTMSFEAVSIAHNINNHNSNSHAQGQHQRHQHQQQQQQHRLQATNAVNARGNITLPLMNADHAEGIFSAEIHENIDSAAGTVAIVSSSPNNEVLVECVMPGIYLSKNFIHWQAEQLSAYSFTHIIIIDKHIQELYYPNQQPSIFKLCQRTAHNQNNNDTRTGGISDAQQQAFDCFCPLSMSLRKSLSFGQEFEVIDLNFGEKSYLTTVLPNCYRAVKFINKALQVGGTILVIDCNGGEQKCLTIIVAYLMYKYNINFSNAFARLKICYKKADLDRFYISQLYEYEPILQVQRAQSRGHSCSRELHAAILKRKKSHDDDDDDNLTTTATTTTTTATISSTPESMNLEHNASTSELLDNLNPLNQFNTAQMENQVVTRTIDRIRNADIDKHYEMTQRNSVTAVTSITGGSDNDWYNWDDYAME
uniref:Dual specificity phosphatase catalytic domain-containing protein n=1 Tax=Glossina pallidipes TaxID=7398 RepID=A0A1A9ZLE0_GLOPL